MRRVSAYLSWYESWWSRHADTARLHDDPIISEGLAAYALQQAKLRTSLRNHFQLLWKSVPSWVAAGSVTEDKQEHRDHSPDRSSGTT
jgi:hypothetical protein